MRQYSSLNDKINDYLYEFNDKHRIDRWVERQDRMEKFKNVKNMLGNTLKDHFHDSQKLFKQTAEMVKEMELN